MHKIMITHFISVACFLFLSSAAAQTAVLDTNGEELVTGIEYYITSPGRGARGGDLSLRNGTCPLAVIQLDSDVLPGTPVTFQRATGANTQPVNIGANLDVEFSSSLCDGSTVWTVGLDAWTRRPAVSTGGDLGFHGDPDYWFQILSYGSNYKLAYCRACEFCRMAPQCRDLTIVWDGRGRRLAPSRNPLEQPFAVRFKRADQADGGIIMI